MYTSQMLISFGEGRGGGGMHDRPCYLNPESD